MSTVRGEKVECKCERCGRAFVARIADRKRGWGRFCSRSCKASEQAADLGGDWWARVYADDTHPFSEDAFNE